MSSYLNTTACVFGGILGQLGALYLLTGLYKLTFPVHGGKCHFCGSECCNYSNCSI